MRQWKIDANDLFSSQDELIEDAYQKQAQEIAYVDKELATVAPALDSPSRTRSEPGTGSADARSDR